MTREEAIRILDPETALQELGRIAYYGGFKHEQAMQKAIDEACKLAIEALKERPKGRWVSNGIPESTLRGCSVCGYTCGAYTFNYCPNCGAEMER